MDDMWSIDAWDRVRSFFPNNENDSRIVVTTRLSNLASELAGSDILEMGFLDEADSWNLLSETVFGEESCPLELVKIGKEIGKSCKGLPLSIVVVGGFLAKSKHTSEFWGYVEENLNSIVSLGDDERCLKVISMSYKQLPIHLKPCFLYMGVYREDEEIRVSKLIKVLVTEGFVKPINGISLEETSKEYLKDLIDRNLILIHGLGCTGKIKCCKIHDVVREFCLREARKERFYYKARPNTPRGIMNGKRRIVISSCALGMEMLDTLRPVSLVCSCVWDLKEEEEEEEEEEVLSLDLDLNYRLLRAEATNSLVNSRYLYMRMRDDCYHPPLDCSFPSSICRFWNLQTLLVDDYFSTVIVVPAEIWCMTQIRHMKSVGKFHLPDPPASGEDGMVLGNLQTLATIEMCCSKCVGECVANLRKD